MPAVTMPLSRQGAQDALLGIRFDLEDAAELPLGVRFRIFRGTAKGIAVLEQDLAEQFDLTAYALRVWELMGGPPNRREKILWEAVQRLQDIVGRMPPNAADEALAALFVVKKSGKSIFG